MDGKNMFVVLTQKAGNGKILKIAVKASEIIAIKQTTYMDNQTMVVTTKEMYECCDEWEELAKRVEEMLAWH